MTKRNILSAVVCGVALIISGLVSVPVLAEGPVDIQIVEMGDDGVGNLIEEWQDITGAMPGTTYNAVPRIQNKGTVVASVRMCLAESGVDATGNVIELDEGTFAIDVNDEYWTLDAGEDDGGSVSSPIAVCYKYNTELSAGSVTEPLFSEVTLSSELGNEHKNATFNLHLYAEAVGEKLDESEVIPANPDTGANTNLEPLTTVWYVSLSVGLAALIGMITYLIAKSLRKK